MPGNVRTDAFLAILNVAALCAIYLPDLGHGFIKDDFIWIRDSGVSSAADLGRLFRHSAGFFRPLVSLTFALDRTLFGLRPSPYGMTNFLMLLGCVVSISMCGRALGLSRPAAIASGTLWSLNFHGINMAVLWVSGRTALLLTFWSVCAAHAFVRRRVLLTAVCTFLALLSKEEAVLLPAILSCWGGLLANGNRTDNRVRFSGRAAWTRSWPLVIPLAIYTVLRAQTAAFTPATALSYYHFTFSVHVIATNVGEFIDRSATLALGVVAAVALWKRQIPQPDDQQRQLLLLEMVWLAGATRSRCFFPFDRAFTHASHPSVSHGRPSDLQQVFVGR